MPDGLRFGIVLYVLRALVILVFWFWFRWPVTEEQGAWLPFYVLDIPWSIIFLGFDYPSKGYAIAAYMMVVGIPWIAYGWILQLILGRRLSVWAIWIVLTAIVFAAVGPFAIMFSETSFAYEDFVRVTFLGVKTVQMSVPEGTADDSVFTWKAVVMVVSALIGAGTGTFAYYIYRRLKMA